MLARIVEFALTQRVLVIAAMLLFAVAGTLAYRALPVDAYPDVSSTQVKIIMKAPGMTPEEVEARITTPIEIEMLGIPNKRIVRSVSKYAIADITLDFADGTDIYWARQQVAERLGAISRDLPATASGGLAPITTPLGEMLMFTIDGDASLEAKRSLLDWVIRPLLRTVPGVADVNALGGLVRTFEVTPDLAALNARGLSLEKLQQALKQAKLDAKNRNQMAGPSEFPEADRVLVDPHAEHASNGLGTVHHVAMAIETGEQQRELRDQLLAQGVKVTDIRDRCYFTSIYFREPGGVLFEVATMKPGFAVDEAEADLGTTLKLPPWEEPNRTDIERHLPEISVPGR